MSSHDLEIVQRPLYSYAEADYLAGVSRGTARRWLTGYAYMGSEGPHVVQPPITSRRDAQGAASFLDLVEIIAIGRMRQTGLSLLASASWSTTVRKFSACHARSP